MSIKNNRELENTRAKLRRFEERLLERDAAPDPNPRVHELTRQSLKSVINQLTEEIVRFESSIESRVKTERIESKASGIENCQQLENTRAKLRLLEDALLNLENRPVTNAHTHKLSRQSLKKLSNQLKEEIVRFEAHLPAELRAK